MAEPKLKRCPFCGGFARLGRGRRRLAAKPYPGASDWLYKPFIGCKINKCGFEREFESVEAAITWWNTRKGEA